MVADFNKSTNTMKLMYYVMGSNKSVIGYKEYTFTMTNNVRNELNGQRINPDVTTKPVKGSSNWYFPRKFPNGIWQVCKSIPKDGSDPYLGDVFIPTNAHQEVPVYGDSKNPMPTATEEIPLTSVGTQEDTAYGFHYSESSTTLGCGRCATQEDAKIYAEWSDKAINSKNGGSFVYVHE